MTQIKLYNIINERFFIIYRYLLGFLLTPILLEEKYAPAHDMNERPIELTFALNCLYKICPKTLLDVGSGSTAWPHLLSNCGINVEAIDKIEGYWNWNFNNRHYYIVKDDITKTKLKKQFDAITCISVLEHIPNHLDAIKGMFTLLKPSGYLIITTPYNEKQYIDNVYKLPSAGYGQNAHYVCQVFSRKEINDWLKDNQATIECQEYYQIFTGEFWTFGKRIYPPRKVDIEEKHHLTCILLRKAEGS